MNYKRIMELIIIILAVIAVTSALDLTLSQVIAVTVFSFLIAGTLLFWQFRLAFAFSGLGALLATGVVNFETIIEFAGLDIIIFLVGMMTVVGYLEERKFFERLVDRIVCSVGGNPKMIILAILLMSALFAALVDEVTSILFMTATVIYLAKKSEVSPVPFIIMVVFATNIGSSATVVGNPVGVLIALRGGLTFTDFLRWATPISISCLLVAIPLSFWYFRTDIKVFGKKMATCEKLRRGELVRRTSEMVEAEEDISLQSKKSEHEKSPSEKKKSEKRETLISWALFLGTIGSLVLHHQIEEAFHLPTNAMLVGTAMIAAGLALFLQHEKARELVEKRVDWWTLTFFLILFASVGTLSYTGVIRMLSQSLFVASGGDMTTAFLLLTVIAALLGATLDNVLAVAALIPLVQDLGALGLYNFPMFWGLLFAGTLFGNLTMIGSTANIVAIGMIERRKLGHITLMQWIKPGALIALPTLALAIVLIYLQIPFMPRL